MRKLILKNDKELEESERWQSEVPYDTRQYAIDECITAYKANETKLKHGDITNYNVMFKNKKTPIQTFRVNKKALKNHHLFVRRFSKNKKNAILRTRKRVRKFLECGSDGDFVIQKYYDKWYICLIHQIQENSKKHHTDEEKIKIEKNQTNYFKKNHKHSYEVAFLDPGIRSFQSFYSPDGICGYIGNQYKQKMQQCFQKMDALQSFHDKPKWKVNKKRLQDKIQRLRTKVSNCINDLHWKFSHFLCKHFKTIMIPIFKTQPMVQRSGHRVFGSKMARMCNALKHYQFRQRLHNVAYRYDSKVVVITEPYTSKTCGQCGNINYALEGSKTYECPKCNLRIDRDLNGARNNGLAYLTMHKATW